MSVNDDLENFHQGNVADDPEYAAAYELFHPRKIKIRSVKLAQGGRLLRISHTNSSSSLERKLDLKRSVRDQKEKLIQAFELKLTTGNEFGRGIAKQMGLSQALLPDRAKERRADQ